MEKLIRVFNCWQKVSECLNLSAELLQWKISTNAERALELIAEALVMSPSSEKLLEMKAEALFMVSVFLFFLILFL